MSKQINSNDFYNLWGGAVYQLCSGVENGATYLFTSFYYQFNFRRSRSCQLNVFPFVNLSFDIIKCEG